MSLAFDVISALQGKTLATAESCTGGMIGSLLTSVSGASKVYKGGIVSYCNEIKHRFLSVKAEILNACGAVSAEVAMEMAEGARLGMSTDIAVSVTGLAGPQGDEFGNPVGLVYIGYSDGKQTVYRQFRFSGSRETIRQAAAEQALALILEMQ